MSQSKKARRLLTSGIPAISAEPSIEKALLLYRGGKSSKPHRKNQRNRTRVSPIYREGEKMENASGEYSLFLVSKRRVYSLLPSRYDAQMDENQFRHLLQLGHGRAILYRSEE